MPHSELPCQLRRPSSPRGGSAILTTEGMDGDGLIQIFFRGMEERCFLVPTPNASIETFAEDGIALKMSEIKRLGLDSSCVLRFSSNLVFIP